MTYLVLVLGAIIAGIGVFGLAQPARMRAMVEQVAFTDPLRYLAAVLRFAIGGVVFLVAEDTDFPATLRVLGGFSFLSGAVVLFLDRKTLQAWLDRAVNWPANAFRGICFVALALGGFLIAAVA